MTGVAAPLDVWPQAHYLPQTNPDYAGNPFIEALPCELDDDGAITAMQSLLRATAAERMLPSHQRMHYLGRLKGFMQPLEAHIDLFHRISVALRRGYVDRNPASPAFVKHLLEAVAQMSNAAQRRPVRQRIGSGSGLTLLGPSGVGKTHAVEAILRTYGQVISSTLAIRRHGRVRR